MIDPIAVVAMLTVGTAIAAWRERRNAQAIRRLAERVSELREVAETAYATGYEHGVEQTNLMRDAEAESIRRNAYQRGKADASRQKAMVA